MRIAFLILTTRCNRRCSYCFYETGYQDRAAPEAVLPLEDRLLSALKTAGVDRLILTGGEPLILPDIAGVVERTVAKGFSPLLLTNGEALTDESLKDLVRAGLQAITISLDSLADEEPGAKAPWEALRRVAEAKGLHASVITPITRANLSSIPEIVTRIHDLGLNLLLQPVFIPENHPLSTKLSLRCCDKAQRRAFLEAVDAWESGFGASRYADLLRDFYSAVSEKPLSCAMGTAVLVVDATGDVYPCFHRQDLKAGNILESDPLSVLARVQEKGRPLHDAHCFGEHCISLFSHL